MKRRNLLRNILIFLFAFIFGYAVKKEGENMILQRVDSNIKDKDWNSVVEEMKGLTEQISDIAINVKNFGAIGDGITDDSGAIKAAIAALPITGGSLIFPNGKYIQGNGTDKDCSFIFMKKNNIKIIGNGSIIQAHPNNPPSQNCRGFWFENCKNISIENLTYNGRLDNRNAPLNDNSEINRQHAFAFREECQQVSLTNVTSLYAMMDGFNCAGGQDYVFINCISEYSFRQGLTIGNAKNLKFIGGSLSKTGKIKGTLPKCGVDVEADGDTTNIANQARYLSFEGVRFDDNAGGGLNIHNGARFVSARNCNFIGTGVYTIGTAVHTVIDSCIFINCSCEVLGDFGVIKNNYFEGENANAQIVVRKAKDGNGGRFSSIEGNKLNNQSITLGSISRVQILVNEANYVKVLDNHILNGGASGASTGDPAIQVINSKGASVKNNTCVINIPIDGIAVWGVSVNGFGVLVEGNKLFGYESAKTNKGIETLKSSGSSIFINNASVTANGRTAVFNNQARSRLNGLPTLIPTFIGGNAIFSHSHNPQNIKDMTIAEYNFKKGDICFNNAITSGGVIGWICVDEGKPGVWEIIGNSF
ncbi:glycosyl hydrolase family 28-related protein [Peribacillus frigoritolerans]|uniref:glycosyl hydrolase family 28-related protein n=1 Tax=Peribacillus frigoritolerans TaxID=450367 RepID=UPI003D276979